MKKLFLLLVLFILPIFISPLKSFAQSDVYVSYQDFYDDLSPYGQWINDPVFGYVWVPNVGNDFRPYFSGGCWVMTRYGNTWVSEYPWGWACFHYGRWTYTDYYGWIWVPGNEWGPGWVSWRWGDGLCGWAPLYPGVDWAGGIYVCPEDWWVFLHPRNLYKRHYHNVWRRDFLFGPLHTHRLIQRTQYVANTAGGNKKRFYSGPPATAVTQATHKEVPVYKINRTDAKGAYSIQNDAIKAYRPKSVELVKKDGIKPVPSNVMQAPQAIQKPEEVKVKWDQPRNFQQTMQEKDPSWNHALIKISAPYNEQQPDRQGQQITPRNIQPAEQQNLRQNNVQPRTGQPVRHSLPTPVQRSQPPPQRQAPPAPPPAQRKR